VQPYRRPVAEAAQESTTRPRASVTSRALALLGAFDTQHPRLTLTEMAARARLPLATAHRLVAELQDWQALARRDDGRYEIGQRLWRLGLLAPVHLELGDVASPFLHDLHAATGDTVHIAVRDGLEALYVERVAGRTSVPVVSRAGDRLPLHATGVGKVLLAHAPPDVVEAALTRLTRVTRATVAVPGPLRRDLEEVRRRGYARTAEEMSLGTSSVAVPVHGADGTVAAALGIVVPTSSRRDLTRLVPPLQVAAAGCSRRLGAEGYGFH
jgi:DNA-binding IclR family transcriptional regulator